MTKVGLIDAFLSFFRELLTSTSPSLSVIPASDRSTFFHELASLHNCHLLLACAPADEVQLQLQLQRGLLLHCISPGDEPLIMLIRDKATFGP